MTLAQYIESELEKAAALSGSVDAAEARKWAAELLESVTDRSLADARVKSLWHRCSDAACSALTNHPSIFGQVLRREGVLAVIQLAKSQASERAQEFDLMATHHETLRSSVRRNPVASAPPLSTGVCDADEAAWRAAITSAAELGPVLKAYASAAERVGRREWAQASTEWIMQQVRSYFRGRGQRAAALQDSWHGRGMTLLADGSGSQRRLKLLDVGSCHDPLRAWSDELQMDVTAIDLHPAPSAPFVHQCDFLELEVSPAGSIPVTASEARDGEVRPLRVLPCAAFDVVVFSLVLSYLPSAALRLRALTKARALLSCDGVLLVVDPKSIAPQGSAPGSELPSILQGWVRTLAPVGLELIRYNRVTQTHCLAFRAVPADPHVDSPRQHSAIGLPIAWDEGRSAHGMLEPASSKKRLQRRAQAKAEADKLTFASSHRAAALVHDGTGSLPSVLGTTLTE
jgi:hypothetical protein